MPALRLIYKLFVLNFSDRLSSGHFLSEYMHYHCLHCVSPADFDVSKTCQDQ